MTPRAEQLVVLEIWLRKKWLEVSPGIYAQWVGRKRTRQGKKIICEEGFIPLVN